MSRLRELEKSARALSSTSVERRREAALTLFDAARRGELASKVDGALAVAAEDEDPIVRRRARLSLVVGALTRNSRMEDEQVVVLDALSRAEATGEQQAVELLESAWRDWQELGVILEHLCPLFAQAIQQPDSRVVLAGLHALRRVAQYSDSVEVAVAPLGRLLAAAPPEVPLQQVALILQSIAERRCDISECAEVLEQVVDRDDDSVAIVAARALGRHVAVVADSALVTRLLTHPSVAVRQGTAEALDVAAHAAIDMQFAISALNTAALDEAGGVSYYALRAIAEAALRGADIDLAREALDKWSQRNSYSEEGWYPYLYYEDASDLRSENPSMEARTALRLGERNKGHPPEAGGRTK